MRPASASFSRNPRSSIIGFPSHAFGGGKADAAFAGKEQPQGQPLSSIRHLPADTKARPDSRGRSMRKFATVLAFVALTAFAPVLTHAEDAKPYADAKEVNLIMLLPPPPANDSAQTKAELGEILTIQVTRTKEMEARAMADAAENIWRFSDAVDNPKFAPANLPKVAAFFDRVIATEA